MCLLLIVSPARGDDPAVSIADLAAYQTALAQPASSSVATPATFRDLWDHPDAHRGQVVRVEGRLARSFRQPGVGQFPPLTEAWITSPLGEPTCLVFPTGPAAPSLGDSVRFVGTFVRRIAYAGADAQRVAPLVVGPAPPEVVAAAAAPLGPIFGGDHALDWGIGLVAALGVGWILLRRHLLRPIPLAPPVGPAPVFLDGGGSLDEASPEGSDDDDF